MWIVNLVGIIGFATLFISMGVCWYRFDKGYYRGNKRNPSGEENTYSGGSRWR